MTKRVLITRPKTDGEALAALLKADGAESVVSPALEIRTMERPPLQTGGVQAVLVTSLNGARALSTLIDRKDVPLYAVGPATAAALQENGFLKVFAAQSDVQSLAELVAAELKPDKGPLVHAGGAVLAGDLKKMLETKGFRVRREVLYSADRTEALTDEAIADLKAGKITDAVFYSPRSMESILTLAERAGVTEALASVRAVCLSSAVARAVPEPNPWKALIISPEIHQSSLLDVLLERVSGIPFVSETKDPETHPNIIAAEASALALNTEPDQSIQPSSIDENGTPKAVDGKPANDKTTGWTKKKDSQPKEELKKDIQSSPIQAGSKQKAETIVIRKRGFPLWVGLPLAILFGFAGALAVPVILPTIEPIVRDRLPDSLSSIFDTQQAATFEHLETADQALESQITALTTRLKAMEDDLAQSQLDLQELRETIAAFADFIGDGVGADALSPSSNQNSDESVGPSAASSAPIPDPVDLDPLLARLTALEDMAAQPNGPDLDVFNQELSVLANDLRTGLAEAAARSSMVEAALERRDARLNEQSGRLDALETARQTDTSAALMALQLSDLKRVADAGQALTIELEALTFFLEREDAVRDALAVLDRLSVSGAQTRYALQAQFRTVMDQTLTRVGDAPETDWWGQLIEAAERAVVIRRRDAGQDPASVSGLTAQAEAAVAAGQLMQAVELLETLPQYTRPAWQDWATAVNDRAALDSAIAAVQRHIMRLIEDQAQ